MTLAILAGGEGRRMGRPKAELSIGGRPILVHLLDRIRWQGPTLLVTAPGRCHPPGWQQFDREVSDAVSGEGPLRGMLTALEHAGTVGVVFATVDMPKVTSEQLQWLSGQLPGNESAAVLLCRGDEERIEPFPCAFRRGMAPLLARRLEEGRRSVRQLASETSVEVLDAPHAWDEGVWMNLNCPADLAEYEGVAS